jgi:hypothetical protein
MNPHLDLSRRYVACLFLLSGVLVLGIIQWSFLPILIQNGAVASTAALELSAGHSSKFAAPFKCLFGDEPKPCLTQSRIALPPALSGISYSPEAPLSGKDDLFLSYHPLRAPPSA